MTFKSGYVVDDCVGVDNLGLVGCDYVNHLSFLDAIGHINLHVLSWGTGFLDLHLRLCSILKC